VEPKFTRINRDNCFGFSFIEMAMVLMIMGIIFTPLIAGLNIYIQNKRIKDTKENIETVRIAISDYVNRNGRLPCPAGLRPEMDTAEFGSEGNCSAVANSISVVPGSRPGTEVVIGAVPFRELRLASTIAQDAWRRRLTYAVTRHLAAPPPGAPPVTTTNPPAGAISFVDISGAPLRGPAGEGLFALISHGANGVGAHTVSSGEISSPCTGAAIETENCNNDFVFLGTSQREAGGADIYDDFATVERDLRGSSALPVCAAGQYVTSDGSRLVCVAATNIPNCTIDGQTLVHQDGAFVCAFVGDFLPIREDYATNPATGMIMQRASCPEGYSLFTPLALALLQHH